VYINLNPYKLVSAIPKATMNGVQKMAEINKNKTKATTTKIKTK
jgi:hypothetical protein